MLVAWLRELGLEFVERTESDEEWTEHDHREQSSGQFKEQRDRRENHPSVQGMNRTIRSAIEEKWEVKIDVTNSVWPWTAEARFLLTSSKSVVTARRRTSDSKENRKREHGLSFAEGLVEKETDGQEVRLESSRACGKTACVWALKQPREKGTGMACGSQERSSGTQRENYGNEATRR